jgi:hypothetical protein
MQLRLWAFATACVLQGVMVGLCPRACGQQVRHVIGPATGLMCMSLKVTDAQARDPTFVVPFYSEPSSGSPSVGRATATVFVRSPVVQQNGYLQAMLFNGKEGWIAANAVKPWTNPGGNGQRCVPSRMSDGSLGISPR